MPKLSRSQIKGLENKIILFQSISLICDGYKITLEEHLQNRRLRVYLFINGEMKGRWFLEENKCPETKFYREFHRYIKTGPKGSQKERVDVGVRQGDFASAGQALRHLNTVCDSVEAIEGDDQ